MFHVQLFGRFRVRADARCVRLRDGSKAQELLAYLLLERRRPHTREALACVLWEECSAERSQAYLRKAVWQLQTGLRAGGEGDGGGLVQVDGAWLQVDAGTGLSLDVEAFEAAYARCRGVAGAALTADDARALADAVALYRGGLLPDYYQEWCLTERERLCHLYLLMLDKLMDYGEAHGECEAGLLYGLDVLRHDAARERTHRQMMRLHRLRGDRTGALRQYRACADVLQRELGVEPMPETKELYDAIRDGASPARASTAAASGPAASPEAARAILDELAALHAAVAGVRRRAESLAGSLLATPAAHPTERPRR